LQVRCQKRKPKGRRYDINEKVLALSLYKTSPKGYRYLSTLFALPSRKTLSGFLNKVLCSGRPWMGIREKIEWDGIKMHGFVDMGINIGTKNDNSVHSKIALVFMAVGVHAHFGRYGVFI